MVTVGPNIPILNILVNLAGLIGLTNLSKAKIIYIFDSVGLGISSSAIDHANESDWTKLSALRDTT